MSRPMIWLRTVFARGEWPLLGKIGGDHQRPLTGSARVLLSAAADSREPLLRRISRRNDESLPIQLRSVADRANPKKTISARLTRS